MSGLPSDGLSHWEGQPVRVWASLWGIPELEAYESLTSTNDRCRTLALAHRPAFSTVVADAQTAGRGRSGGSWASAPGLGLWLSTLVVAAGHPRSPMIPLLLGLAVIRAVGDVAPEAIPALKWPNDVWVADRKLCGILCEATGNAGAVVAGIGINLAHRPGDFPPELRHQAVSLEMVVGRPISRGDLAGRLLHHVKALMTDPPSRLEGALAGAVATLDLLAGRQVEVSTGIRGVGRGISADGALLVEAPGGSIHAVSAGTVRLLEPAGAAAPRPDTKGV